MNQNIDPEINWELEPDHAGLVRAQHLLAIHSAQVLVELTALTEKGSPMGMLYTGLAYASGVGTKIDLSEAEKWYRRAAEAGSVRAYYQLGRLYLDTRRFGEAKDAFEIAAARDFMPAVHMLGKIYYFGFGVDKDLEKAISLLERAAKWGSVFAKRLLAYHLIHSGEGWSAVLRGIAIQCRCYFDLLVVVCTEGTTSDRLR